MLRITESIEREKPDMKGTVTKTPGIDCHVEEDIYPEDMATVCSYTACALHKGI